MKRPARTPRPLEVGTPVTVTEDNIPPWSGEAVSVKWSPVSGWWIDVETGHGVFSMPSRVVRKETRP